jgi:ABC-type transport system substrate-binding protein
MDSAILKKDKVRLALNESIDKEALIKSLSNKTSVDTPLLELKQSDWVTKVNVEQAKGALFDSGYKMDADGKSPYRKDAKGNGMKLVMLVRQYEDGSAQAQETKVAADFLKKSWGDIGIEIDAQYADESTFNDRLRGRDYDLVLTGQSLGYNFDTYSYWHSSQANADGLNLSNYRSFASDALIERIRDTFDSTLKEKLVKELAKEISLDIPAVFLFRPTYTFATDNKVKGIELANLAFLCDRFAHIERWCIGCK